MTFLSYVAEQAIVSLIDIVVCAIAALLVMKGGKARLWGLVLAGLYVLAIIGTAMSGEMHLGPIFGVIAALTAAILMRRRLGRARSEEAEKA